MINFNNTQSPLNKFETKTYNIINVSIFFRFNFSKSSKEKLLHAEKCFSTCSNLRSDDPNKSLDPNKLVSNPRLEKNELYEKHYKIIETLHEVEEELEDYCNTLNAELGYLAHKSCNESELLEIYRRTDDIAKTINQHKNEMKKLTENNSMGKYETDSVSSSGSLDVGNENKMMEINKTIIKNRNDYSNIYKSFLENKRSDNPELFQYVDEIERKKDDATNRYTEASLEQSELIEKYAALREECLKDEMSDRGSLIDDYADLSTEMPDYMDPDF